MCEGSIQIAACISSNNDDDDHVDNDDNDNNKDHYYSVDTKTWIGACKMHIIQLISAPSPLTVKAPNKPHVREAAKYYSTDFFC